MKKVIVLFCIIILAVSSQGQHRVKSSAVQGAHTTFISCIQQSYHSLVQQFQFNPSDIYGDVFSNKAWH
jgi:hypothetical protein